MKMDVYEEYLMNSGLSSKLLIKISQDGKEIADRISVLKHLTQNKKVIHIGCADHKDLILQKQALPGIVWLISLGEHGCTVSPRPSTSPSTRAICGNGGTLSMGFETRA